MYTVFDWIENSSLSLWIREDPTIWAFPFILILHTVGMGFLVGTNVALGARILGVGRGVPLAAMRPFFKVMWAGFAVNAVSGVALLIGYPTKALTNPLFYVKLALIGAGLVQSESIRRQIAHARAAPDGEVSPRLRTMAVLSLTCWLSAIAAGRLLAYTYSHLMAFEDRF